MAKRRMFSQVITDNDVFLDMPLSAQALYFHLCLHADDDGFVGPKKVARMVGSSESDLSTLYAHRYLLSFDSGAAVIKHWLIHNSIRSDRYSPTTFTTEKLTLGLNDFDAYTEKEKSVKDLPEVKKKLATKSKPVGNQTAAQVRLGKVRLVNNKAKSSGDSKADSEKFLKDSDSEKIDKRKWAKASQADREQAERVSKAAARTKSKPSKAVDPYAFREGKK